MIPDTLNTNRIPLTYHNLNWNVTGGGSFSLASENFRRRFDGSFAACTFIHLSISFFLYLSLFFEMGISSRALFPLFRPGSIHSGSTTWDDCDRHCPIPDKKQNKTKQNKPPTQTKQTLCGNTAKCPILLLNPLTSFLTATEALLNFVWQGLQSTMLYDGSNLQCLFDRRLSGPWSKDPYRRCEIHKNSNWI